jgi:hypothetical protein
VGWDARVTRAISRTVRAGIGQVLSNEKVKRSCLSLVLNVPEVRLACAKPPVPPACPSGIALLTQGQNGFDAVADLKLLHDVRHVMLHGLFAQ